MSNVFRVTNTLNHSMQYLVIILMMEPNYRANDIIFIQTIGSYAIQYAIIRRYM